MNFSLFRDARFSAAVLCIVIAWLFPYSAGGSRDAMQQLVGLGALATASLLFGLSTISILVSAAFVGGLILMMGTPNPYWGVRIAGVAGLMLAALAVHVGANLRRHPARLPWFLMAVIIAALLNALEGLLQWMGLVGELYRWVVEPERRGLAFGALRQPNLFATFLCVGSVCTIWLVHLRRLTPAMACFLLPVLMLGVAASGSRTGVLEVVVLGIWAWFLRKKQTTTVTRLFLGQMVALALAMVVLPMVANMLDFGYLSGADRVGKVGHDPRLLIWSNAIELIQQRPWVGWGWRETGYGHYMTLFGNRHNELLENVHNLPLQLAVEFGLPLTALGIFSIIWALLRSKPLKTNSDKGTGSGDGPSSQLFAWAILLLIVGIHSMLEQPLWYVGFLFLTGVSVGYVLPLQTRDAEQGAFQVRGLRTMKLSALLLIILSVVAWQQYAKVLLIYKTPFTNNRDVQRASVAAAINNASGAWLFQEHVDFALLGWTMVTPHNAIEVRRRSEKLLHFSAEPRVIEPLLLSLWYLQDINALKFHAEQYCRAFPGPYEHWRDAQSGRPILPVVKQATEKCR